MKKFLFLLLACLPAMAFATPLNFDTSGNVYNIPNTISSINFPAGKLTVNGSAPLVPSAIGATVQAYSANLTTFAGVTPGSGVAAALAIAINNPGGFSTIRAGASAGLWVDATLGNDGSGTRGVSDLPYLTIDAAIAAASAGDTIYISTGPFASPTTMKTGLHFVGAGEPSINAAGTALVNGTILQGSFLITAPSAYAYSGVQIMNVGFDCGTTVCAALYSGATNINAFFVGSSGGTYGDTAFSNFLFRNCIALCAIGSTGNHAFDMEGCTNGTFDNITTYYGQHGLILKGQHLNVSNCFGNIQGEDGIIIKSQDTGTYPLYASDINVSNYQYNGGSSASESGDAIEIQDYSSVSAPGACHDINISNGTAINGGSGVILQLGGTYSPYNINISNFTTVNCGNCVSTQGGFSGVLKNVQVSNCAAYAGLPGSPSVTSGGGYGFSFLYGGLTATNCVSYGMYEGFLIETTSGAYPHLAGGCYAYNSIDHGYYFYNGSTYYLDQGLSGSGNGSLYGGSGVPVLLPLHFWNRSGNNAATNTTSVVALDGSSFGTTFATGTKTIGALLLQQTTPIKMHAEGQISATGSDSVTLKVLLGSTTLNTITYTPASLTSAMWELDVCLENQGGGTSGAGFCIAVLKINGAVVAQSTPFDSWTTTSDQTVGLTAQWSAASASDYIGAGFELNVTVPAGNVAIPR